ncbi:MAG: TrkA-N domain protein [candidate division TM6 bacterium GW2011_GWF2_32_72]|nr:MAG: TrkA-N domain protein [candidate division TM6 bacterium GW2011_GWF2_32_72]
MLKVGVLGLGRFGRAIATRLTENGAEVLAVDPDEEAVQSIRDFVTEAVCMNITNKEALEEIGMKEMDIVIVAIGSNLEKSVLLTALLKTIGVKNIIAKCKDSIHKEILNLMGVSRVVQPEQEIGIKLADKITSPFKDVVKISENFMVSQIKAPKKFIGKAISELHLFENYSAICIGLKKENEIIPIDPNYIIQKDDNLSFAGSKKSLEEIADL